jgi:general secretion pathway protein I
LFRASPHNQAADGFTLIEALIALSIVTIVLASIGALIATNVRATQSIEAHLTRLETARAIMTALPDRAELKRGDISGETDDHPWRVDVSPLSTRNTGGQDRTPWRPLAVVVTVRSRTGGAIQLSTVRLQRNDGR